MEAMNPSILADRLRALVTPNEEGITPLAGEMTKAWDESKHPRRPNGEFGNGMEPEPWQMRYTTDSLLKRGDAYIRQNVKGTVAIGIRSAWIGPEVRNAHGMTKDEARPFAGWASWQDCKKINDRLRGGGAWTEHDMRQQSLIQSSTTKRDIVAFRGVNESALSGLTVGSTFTDRGFVSTSVLADVAGRFGHGEIGGPREDNAVVQVNIPKGSNAVGITGIEESEVLLGASSKFRVTSTPDNGGQWTVEYLGCPKGRVGFVSQAKKGISETSRFAWGKGDIIVLSTPAAKADWDESKHPRGPDGRFGSGGSSSATATREVATREQMANAHIIETYGLDRTRLHDYLLENSTEPRQGQPLPDGYERGTPKECFKNASQLVADHQFVSGNPTLQYCEGVVTMKGEPTLSILHGWVVDAQGNVIDNTLPDPENWDYMGIVYPWSQYSEFLLQTGMYGVLGGSLSMARRVLRDGGILDEN
jgi:hypothetical protein